MKTADWYFDFISPYAYLQCARLGELSDYAQIRARPVLFAGLLNHHGQLGPAEIAPKREFIFRQALWLAIRQGLPMKLPPAHPFKPLPPLRLAIAMDCDIEAIRTIFDFIWRDGRDVDNPREWEQLIRALNLDNTGFDNAAFDNIDAQLSDPLVKQTLHDNTNEAIARGIFGVPTLVVDDELFWGHDASDFFLDYLNDGQNIKRNIFAPVDGLAQGSAQRKQIQRK
jgi:2-hydroxychromene-2-carboxylate isomerase